MDTCPEVGVVDGVAQFHLPGHMSSIRTALRPKTLQHPGGSTGMDSFPKGRLSVPALPRRFPDYGSPSISHLPEQPRHPYNNL